MRSASDIDLAAANNPQVNGTGGSVNIAAGDGTSNSPWTRPGETRTGEAAGEKTEA